MYVVITLVFLAAFLLIYGVFIFFILISIWTGAPYVPTSEKRTRVMMDLAGIRPGERVGDLGSGDGRLLIAAARAGAAVTGWEVNPALVVWSRLAARLAGLADRIAVQRGNFWKAPLRDFDVIFLYLLPATMDRIGRKIRQEANPGARIIVNAFPLPGWPLEAREGAVYRYRVPPKILSTKS